MKIRIEVDPNLQEEICVIHCRQMDGRVQRLQALLSEGTQMAPTFYKGEEEYFFPLDDVLFFEMQGDKAYAHTAQDAYFVRGRLYELERILPRRFIRVSKSAILNVWHVFSIQRNLASASLVQFRGSHKQVYISRQYYKECKQRLDDERSRI